MKNLKFIFSVTACALLYTQATFSMEAGDNNNNGIKTSVLNFAKNSRVHGAGLIGSSVGLGFYRKTVANALTKPAKFFNLNSADVVNTLIMGLAATGVSKAFFPNEPVKYAVGRFVALLVAYTATTSNVYNTVMSKVPFIDMACHDDKCQGLCNKCKLRKFLVAYMASNAFVTGANSAKAQALLSKVWSGGPAANQAVGV